jgi:hypothetical protein
VTPRPNDLEFETQQDLANAALESLTAGEHEALLWWMVEFMPHGFLVAVEGLRVEQQLGDGWDQAD